jgi:HD-like signal output (HDOD) protein
MKNTSQKLERLPKTDLRSLFSELDERDLQALYSLCEIRTLAPGEVLIKEGDTDQTAYLILKGEFKIIKDVNGQAKEIAVLRNGDWVGEIAFRKKVPRTASAVATVPSNVMAMNKHTLDALSAETQLFFLKKLNDLANERNRQLIEQQKELDSLNRRLLDRICSDRLQEDHHYGESEIIRRIIQKIPRLPSFAITLLIQLSDKNISLRKAIELIKQDPSSVAVVLKEINSSYYGLSHKVSDINRALLLMGFGRTYQLILAEGLRRCMPDTPSFRDLQFHCMAISNIAFALSLTSQIGNASEVATVGLLHDLGRGIILLLKKQNPSLGILLDSLNHAKLGALLLKEWGMPDLLTRCVEFQSYPENLPPDMLPLGVRNNVTILYLSHLCLDLLNRRSGETSSELFLKEYLKPFGWERLDIEGVLKQHLLPTLTKNIEGYPVPFKELINGYISPSDQAVE